MTEINNNFQDPKVVSDLISKDERYWKDLKPTERDQIEFKIRRAVMQLIVKYPFFGYMATKVCNEKVFIKNESQLRTFGKFKTMATDGKRIYIWPQYVLYNDVQAVMGTIMHELFHVMLLHISRANGYNMELANIAMDYTVNMMVNDFAREDAGFNKTSPLDERTYKGMPWYVPAPPGLYDERWRDSKTNDPMMWEKIYEQLLKEQNPETQKRLQQGMGISEATGGQGLKGQDPNQGLHDSHDFWNPKNRPADENGNINTEKFDASAAREMVREAYVQSAENKMRGTMPAGMEKIIHEWLHPPLPWQRLVQNYLKPAVGDFSYNPGDTRFDDPFPWLTEEFKLRYIVISIDTSGSMSDAEVGSAIQQARHLLRGFPQTKGILCMCDAQVDYWDDIMKAHTITKRVGYGGTNFNPPFEMILEKKIEDETDLHIYFTDGYGNFPTDEWLREHKINFDTLWVITNNDVEVPKSPKYRWTRLNPLLATSN